MGERALQIRDHLWSGLPNSRSNTPLNGKNPRRRFGLKDVKDKILEQLTANTDVRLPSKVWTKYGLRATRFDRIVSDTVWLPCDIPFWSILAKWFWIPKDSNWRWGPEDVLRSRSLECHASCLANCQPPFQPVSRANIHRTRQYIIIQLANPIVYVSTYQTCRFLFTPVLLLLQYCQYLFFEWVFPCRFDTRQLIWQIYNMFSWICFVPSIVSLISCCLSHLCGPLMLSNPAQPPTAIIAGCWMLLTQTYGGSFWHDNLRSPFPLRKLAIGSTAKLELLLRSPTIESKQCA